MVLLYRGVHVCVHTCVCAVTVLNVLAAKDALAFFSYNWGTLDSYGN